VLRQGGLETRPTMNLDLWATSRPWNADVPRYLDDPVLRQRADEVACRGGFQTRFQTRPPAARSARQIFSGSERTRQFSITAEVDFRSVILPVHSTHISRCYNGGGPSHNSGYRALLKFNSVSIAHLSAGEQACFIYWVSWGITCRFSVNAHLV
jgi:hypothetical protein